MRSSDPNQKTLPPFATLRAFEAAGRLGGIRRAATALGLDHAVVSRHLRSLEEWAGVRLIQRERGANILTKEGERFHARIRHALEEITQASAELLSTNESQQLRIWCMPGFASKWLTLRLPDFHAANPDIEIELRPTDDSPDFSRCEADIDIRYVMGNRPVSSAVTTGGTRRVELARPWVVPVASPATLEAFGPVHSPADLLHAPLLHEENPTQWQLWFKAHGVECAQALPGPRLWHAHLTLDAARCGQGFALANPFLLGDDLRTGHLVAPLGAECSTVELGAYVFAARADRWNARAVACFRRWLRLATASIDTPPRSAPPVPLPRRTAGLMHLSI